MARTIHSLPITNDDEGWRIWLEELREQTNNLINYAREVPLSCYISEIGRGTQYSNIHGNLIKVSTGDALPAGYSVDVGTGKLVFILNAGTDVVGDIIVTGTKVNRKTGEQTASFSERVSVDRLTTDNTVTGLSGPDAAGNRYKWDLKNAYITSEWYVGNVTISGSGLTITDMDTCSIAFEQFNDSGETTLDTLDITLYEVNTAARFHVYLYSVDVTGSKVNIQAQVDLNMGTPTAANRYFRMRKTGIDKKLDTTKDGIFVTLWYNTPTSNIEDLTCKVWYTTGE